MMGTRRVVLAGGFAAVVCLVSVILLWRMAGPARDLSAQGSAAPPAARTTVTVNEANVGLRDGTIHLLADGPAGYLRSVLSAFAIPPESQLLVFSKTSLQSDHISPENPRALYFNDTVAVGWVSGTNSLELAELDPREGVVFYTLEQASAQPSQFIRDDRCLQCHVNPFTGNIPGLLAISMLPLADNTRDYAQGWPVDHRTPIPDRWGGWYITGTGVPRVHLGNVPVNGVEQSYVRMPEAPMVRSASERFDTSPYPSPHSDVVAQLVFNHQVGMTNLIARLMVESQGVADTTGPMSAGIMRTVNELVDYLLFVDEAPIPGPLRGSSGFAESFQAAGPRDSQGRSLRQLDLERRLMRYPCSYMIYTSAFDSLPDPVGGAVYARMWQILSGELTDEVYTQVPAERRRAIVEILLETKPGLPEYFQASAVR